MKKLESVLLFGCAYSILICAVFYAFAAISGFTDAEMSASRFFLIVLFGQVVSLANFVVRYAPWHVILKYAVHYLALFVSFFFVFIIGGKISVKGGAAIFSSLVVFTFFYIIFWLIAFVIKKAYSSINKKAVSAGKSKKKITEKEQYVSRFK